MRDCEEQFLRRTADGLQRLTQAAPAGIAILGYHRVAPIKSNSHPTWNVAPERFRGQLEALLDGGFRAVSLNEVLDQTTVHEGGEGQQVNWPDDNRRLIVTFDDGHASVLHFALPILQELQIPATVFLATGYVDSPDPLPFDDWLGKGTNRVRCETWRALRRGECDELLRSGLITFGSHTHSHVDFRGKSELLAEDLEQSIAMLHHWFGVDKPPFAFPYGIQHLGFCSPELTAVVRRCGMTCALSLEPDWITAGRSPYNWGRYAVHQSDSPRHLRRALNSWYPFVRQCVRRGTRSIRPSGPRPTFPGEIAEMRATKLRTLS
ncbi:MAG: polysaccharide deacetylase family protein [Planctomycetales bacterium]|nr:polysaccharide deacetylase family protein [Planctomycetales bacterium]